MAYALRGCGIVLKSDIDKRNKAFAQNGRTAGQPVVASLFIHSVVQPATQAEHVRVRVRLRVRGCCGLGQGALAGVPLCVLRAFAVGDNERACESRRAARLLPKPEAPNPKF
jgi:hypothetical protein